MRFSFFSWKFCRLAGEPAALFYFLDSDWRKGRNRSIDDLPGGPRGLGALTPARVHHGSEDEHPHETAQHNEPNNGHVLHATHAKQTVL
jgi:hypothetical protein